MCTCNGGYFDNVSKNAIKEVQKWMNDYPRKILGWLTPDELYNMEINISPQSITVRRQFCHPLQKSKIQLKSPREFGLFLYIQKAIPI